MEEKLQVTDAKNKFVASSTQTGLYETLQIYHESQIGP
jgi:hypothetical protein